MKLVIVGGVAGGASAAARARRLSEEAEIILFERGPDISFANCGLPYYVGETIKERQKLLITSPEQMRLRFKIDVRTLSSVESIDRDNKKVRVRDLRTGKEYEETFDKLVLAPGAAPFRPGLKGIDLPGVHTLRNMGDVDAIKKRVDQGAQRVLVVGAGFIGLELVENFVHRGLDTTIVELGDQLLPPFDREMTKPIQADLQKRGVKLHFGDSAEAFEPNGNAITVHLKSGKKLEADLVVLGIGVRPENKLAQECGLAVGPRGGIKTDPTMVTNDPNIYAVGDAVEVTDFVTQTPTQVPLAGPANRQGRIAADNIFGRSSTYRGTQGTAILGCFELTAAATGLSEKTLSRLSQSYHTTYIHPMHHASYYPGAEGMVIKLLFSPDSGQILGAQIVGGEGVDKRIDILAVAIQARMTVYDLEEMELAYSPQFGSAKDPINMAGFVAAGLLRGDHPQIGPQKMLADAKDLFILDVRSKAEFAAGAIEGASNIPVDDLRNQLASLPKDKKIAVYCEVGMRGYIATRILLQNGFTAVNLSGGYRTYKLFRE